MKLIGKWQICYLLLSFIVYEKLTASILFEHFEQTTASFRPKTSHSDNVGLMNEVLRGMVMSF